MSALDLTAAVEAAARGMWGGTPDPFERPREWDDVASGVRHSVREAALLAVTAAAPLIEAAVREQVAREIEALRTRPAALVDGRLAVGTAARIARGDS